MLINNVGLKVVDEELREFFYKEMLLIHQRDPNIIVQHKILRRMRLFQNRPIEIVSADQGEVAEQL